MKEWPRHYDCKKSKTLKTHFFQELKFLVVSIIIFIQKCYISIYLTTWQTFVQVYTMVDDGNFLVSESSLWSTCTLSDTLKKHSNQLFVVFWSLAWMWYRAATNNDFHCWLICELFSKLIDWLLVWSIKCHLLSCVFVHNPKILNLLFQKSKVSRKFNWLSI